MQTHQTVRLSRGSHRSPDQGVCVMELASMLAGERFSDRPRSVSPVIRGFLRTYNDALDDARRQDLYAYAARVVGTRAPRPVERARARHCLELATRLRGSIPVLGGLRPLSTAGSFTARCIGNRDHSPALHDCALALVDQLIAFSDGWAGVLGDPGELLGGATRRRPDRHATA